MKAAGVVEEPRCRLGRPSGLSVATPGARPPDPMDPGPPIDWSLPPSDEPLHPLIRLASLEPRDDDDFDLHPAYDLDTQYEALFSTPYDPNNALLRWQDLGDLLIRRGEDDLLAALAAARAVLDARIAADPTPPRSASAPAKRRRRRRSITRAKR